MSNHAPEYVKIMETMFPLFQKQGTFKDVPFEKLLMYVAPAWNRGTFAFISDQEGSPKGVCLIRIFSRLEDFLDPFVHHPQGQFLMIDALVADNPVICASLHDEMLDRWGRREIILWDRGEKTEDGAPRMYRWENFRKLVRRMCKDGRV